MENKRCHRNTLTRLLAILLVLCGVMTAAQAEGTSLRTDRPDQSAEITTTIGCMEDTDKQQIFVENMPEGFQLFLDDNNVYLLTYTIAKNAEAKELTVDLTNALRALSAYYPLTNSPIFQPGDSRVFDIWIQSDSKHIYRYKQGSFTLTTGAMNPEEDPVSPEVTAFDGQALTADYVGRSKFTVSFRIPPITDALVESGARDRYDALNRPYKLSSWEENKLLTYWRNKYGDQTLTLEQCAEKCLLEYYSEKDGVTYTDLMTMQTQSAQAQQDIDTWDLHDAGVCELPANQALRYDTFYNNTLRFVYGKDLADEATGKITTSHTTTQITYNIIDYSDGSPKEVNGCVAANTISDYYVRRSVLRFLQNKGWPDDTLVQFSSDGIGAGFELEDGSIATASNCAEQAKEFTTSQAEYEHVEWHRAENPKISRATIGEYMKGEASDIWKDTDAFFANLMKDGIYASSNQDEGWVQFRMASNIDGLLAGNTTQDTVWPWHNSIVLERVDGELEVQKVDARSQSTLTEPAEFRLWQYRTDKNGAQVKYLYDDAKDSFVPYDAQKGLDAYNLATVNGKISIEYALLEHEIYYLQEAESPDGYKLKDTVFILADSRDALETAAKALKADKDVSDKAPMEYGGAIQVTEPLTIKVKNEPVPTPTPKRSTPTPVPPPNEFLMYFYKEWPDGQPQDIFFTLYTADGKVYKHTFKKIAVGENKFRYEAWLANDSEFFVIETEMKDYKVTYKNTGKYADITDRCYKGGTIVNSRVPTTGDSMSPVWMLLALASGCALLILKKRRAT